MKTKKWSKIKKLSKIFPLQAGQCDGDTEKEDEYISDDNTNNFTSEESDSDELF